MLRPKKTTEAKVKANGFIIAEENKMLRMLFSEIAILF
jgi:hypothetical protein